nr:hypothetical protein [Mucilaginibacter sp. X5P1]
MPVTSRPQKPSEINLRAFVIAAVQISNVISEYEMIYRMSDGRS